MHVARIDLLASRHAPPIEEELRAIGIRILHRVRVEILVHVRDSFRTLAVVAAAPRLSLYRPFVFHPTEMIDDVDVIVVEAAAAGPDEAMEALHLVEQIADAGRFGKRGEVGDGPMHPVTPLEDDLADLAVMDTLGQFLERPAVTRHQSHPYLEVFGGGVLGEAQHAFAGGAVDSDRLLHEDIEALLDG